ncbi:MAG: Uxx-star family glutaredoxin-like (seleno)protein [bacterium]|nr:Uxx-star family glutaredoxin-like (seleno)protein [bacterium]
MVVKIFSTPGCAYCHTLKEFFKEKGIQFEEIDVSKDKVAQEEMIKKSGAMEVPVVEIDDQIVVGFDKIKIVKLLKLQE